MHFLTGIGIIYPIWYKALIAALAAESTRKHVVLITGASSSAILSVNIEKSFRIKSHSSYSVRGITEGTRLFNEVNKSPGKICSILTIDHSMIKTP